MGNKNTVSRSTIIGAGLRDISTLGAVNGRAVEASLNPKTGSAALDTVKALGDFLSGGKSKAGWSNSSSGRKSNTGKGVNVDVQEALSKSIGYSISKGVQLGQSYSPPMSGELSVCQDDFVEA